MATSLLKKKDDEEEKEETTATEPYKYKEYVESSNVSSARSKLAAAEASKPGEYQSKYADTIAALLDKINNREEFTYDINSDMLYNQYKDQYITLGKNAMADTIGQASAMTGGYGNSYATTAGQQAYQGYLQQLNDIVPDLYQLALEKYNAEGEDLYNRYGVFQSAEDSEYSKYRDTVADYQADRAYYANLYQSERDYDYNKYTSDRNFDYTTYNDERNFNESVRQYNQTFAENQRQYNETLAENIRQYNQTLAENKRQFDLSYEQDAYQFEASLAEQKRQADMDYSISLQNLMLNYASLAQDQNQYESSLAWEKEKYANTLAQQNYENSLSAQQQTWQQNYYDKQLEHNIAMDIASNNLDTAKLAETIRSNKADEAYNTALLNAKYTDSSSSSSSSSSVKTSTPAYKALGYTTEEKMIDGYASMYDKYGESYVMNSLQNSVNNGLISASEANNILSTLRPAEETKQETQNATATTYKAGGYSSDTEMRSSFKNLYQTKGESALTAKINEMLANGADYDYVMSAAQEAIKTKTKTTLGKTSGSQWTE